MSYIITYYLPSGLFVVVSWISFLIPPDIVPGMLYLSHSRLKIWKMCNLKNLWLSRVSVNIVSLNASISKSQKSHLWKTSYVKKRLVVIYSIFQDVFHFSRIQSTFLIKYGSMCNFLISWHSVEHLILLRGVETIGRQGFCQKLRASRCELLPNTMS